MGGETKVEEKTGVVSENKHSFVGYITAGFPNRTESLSIIKKCCQSGLDILELGFPAKDSCMDGEVIRKAQEQVDKTLAEDLGFWREIRGEINVPIWLMGYRQDLLHHDIYLTLAKENLYNALVIPDTDQNEREHLQKLLSPFHVDVVGFINNEMEQDDIDRVLRNSAIVYHQLYCGPTGVAHNDNSYLPLMHYARGKSKARLFAGFGINSAERVMELIQNGYDGTIIGSAIMKMLENDEEQAYRFIQEIHCAIRSVE